MPPPVPTLGGRYRLGPELGRGGMSTVYRAVDLQAEREVAVKVYATGASFDARTRQQREATLGAGLSHTGIVPILDHGEQHDPAADTAFVYLVTELVEGSTLRDRLASGPCTPSEVAALGARLASALGYLHDRGIVHRDIKPANVLLDESADVSKAMLADFGVAIRLDDTRVTVEGCVVGTAAYLSPEQVSGKPITPASDVYSLGLVLIEALSGVTSYEGSGVECALARLHRQPEIPLSAPGWLATLLTAMTAIDAQSRPTAFDVEIAFSLGESVSDGDTTVLDLLATPEPPKPMVYALLDQPTGELAIDADTGSRPRLAVLLGIAGAAVVVLTAGALASQSGATLPTPPAARPPISKTTFPGPTPTHSTAPKVAAKVTVQSPPATHYQAPAHQAPVHQAPAPIPAPAPPHGGPGHGDDHGPGHGHGRGSGPGPDARGADQV